MGEPEWCPECVRIRERRAALEKGGNVSATPTCPACNRPVFTSAMERPALEMVPSPAEGSFEEPSTALARPKRSVASFLREMADDLDAGRAHTVGTDFQFQRIRIMSMGYDLFFGRYDPDRDHPHRYRR